jgi:hypothetical protein
LTLPELPLQGGHHPGPLFGPICKKKSGQGRFRSKTYRRKVRQATPAWADPQKVRDFYREAKRLTKLTGHRHSVDHIIPLKGETVCGLHVHTNLEVKLHAENMSKGNRFEEQLGLF